MSTFHAARVFITALLLALTSTTTFASDDSERTLSEGRALSKAFLDRDTDAIWNRMTPQMHAALKDAASLAGFRDQLAAQLGGEQQVLSERAETKQGFRTYRRIARWSKAPMPIELSWSLDASGGIAGFHVRPAQPPLEAAPSAHLDYQTKAHLRLPFDGEWYVFWGGRTLAQNHHAANANQRFAYDMVKHVDGRSHRGEGKALTDYHCWNEKILVPAAARVVAAVDGLPDQAIGTTNATQAAGNHVVLDLGGGEYAVLAHLRNGSVRVKPGDRVLPGKEVGRCGNSGNTSEPHLHFHVQNAPGFGEGDGLPAYFNDYNADGSPVTRGEPLQGQSVRQH